MSESMPALVKRGSNAVIGAALLVGVKATPGNEAISEGLGADLVLNHREHDPVETILEMTDGEGVDCVVDASGTPDAFPDAI